MPRPLLVKSEQRLRLGMMMMEGKVEKEAKEAKRAEKRRNRFLLNNLNLVYLVVSQWHSARGMASLDCVLLLMSKLCPFSLKPL